MPYETRAARARGVASRGLVGGAGAAPAAPADAKARPKEGHGSNAACSNDPARSVAGVRVPPWLNKGSPARQFLDASILVFLLVVTLLEVMGAIQGGPTISGELRLANSRTSGLVALVFFAVGIHMFVDFTHFKLWSDPKYVEAYNCRP